jgi:hypothetical protein
VCEEGHQGAVLGGVLLAEALDRIDDHDLEVVCAILISTLAYKRMCCVFADVLVVYVKAHTDWTYYGRVSKRRTQRDVEVSQTPLEDLVRPPSACVRQGFELIITLARGGHAAAELG